MGVPAMSHIISYPATRYSCAGATALIITSFLFYLMQFLIRNDLDPVPADVFKPISLDFVNEPPEEPRPETMKIEPFLPPEDPPPAPEPAPVATGSLGETLTVTGPADDFGKMLDGPEWFGPGTTDIIALAKVQPVYPPGAKRMGIEGYVIVEFTVTGTGTTKDVKVVAADPPGVFDRAALRAASRFKYKPRILENKPVEVTGVRNKFTFRLTD